VGKRKQSKEKNRKEKMQRKSREDDMDIVSKKEEKRTEQMDMDVR
jgi:hypothetical protein